MSMAEERGKNNERKYPYGEETEEVIKEMPDRLDAMEPYLINTFGERLGKEYAAYKEGDKQYGIQVKDKRGKTKFESIKTSQIRSVFGEIKKIEMKWRKVKRKEKIDFSDIERDLELLKPKLAYAARHAEVKPLKRIIDKAIDGFKNSSEKEKALENFFKFVESLVAYHKFYGGQE